jgi:hypothetical protein
MRSEFGCKTSARGATGKCVAHGGGKRCSEVGCKASAQGATDKCIAHGGGKRCSEVGCKTSALGTTGKCQRHSKLGAAVECGPIDRFFAKKIWLALLIKRTAVSGTPCSNNCKKRRVRHFEFVNVFLVHEFHRFLLLFRFLLFLRFLLHLLMASSFY